MDGPGRFYPTKQAVLHTRPERRPPLYVSAFAPRAAEVAGRLGDGRWTLADPETAPEVIDAYRGAAEDAGRQPGRSSSMSASRGPRTTPPPWRAPRCGRPLRWTSSPPTTGTTPTAEPHRAMRTYRDKVLPALRGATVGQRDG